MYKIAELCGKKHQFDTLSKSIIKNKIISIKNFANEHPTENGPVFKSELVFIDKCDKNFIYYWLNKKTFPNAQCIYLACHPCDDVVFKRNLTIKLVDNDFTKRWQKYIPAVNIIKESHYNYLLNNCKPEDIEIIKKE